MQNSEPRVNHTKRKADVVQQFVIFQVNLLHEFLIRNNLFQTANLLKKEAFIADKENMEQYIRTIQDSNHLLEEQKLHKIKTELEKRYFKEISSKNFDEALKIFNEKMPLYFSELDLERFAENLIPSLDQNQNNQKDDCLLLKMFCSYFIKNPIENAELPNTRIKIFTCQKEVWFLKFSGKYLVAIDENRKAIIFSKQLELLYLKQNMHEKIISNVKWRNEQEFATSSESGQIKLWNQKLEQLHVFNYHKKLITSISFFFMGEVEYLVSGGHDKFIAFKNLTEPTEEIAKIKLKQLVVKDIKYYKKRNQLIFLNEKKKEISVIKFFNPDTMKWMSEIKANQVFFEMQISPNDDILHVITSDGQIINYSLKTHQKLGVFLGTIVKNFVIRMEKGGYMNQFLATGSQYGQILIYSGKKVQPVKRLKTLQKTIVNSVTWIDSSSIVCACDNGKIQYWTYEKQRELHIQS